MAAGFSRIKTWIANEILNAADLNAEIDNILNNVAVANGIASLNSSTKVVEDPANATATPTASKIPIANASGKLDISWLNEPIDTFTAADTLTAAHTTCLFNHATTPFTLTLPTIGDVSSATYQKVYRFRNINAAVGTIGGTVDGVSNPTLAQDESMLVYGDGTTWRTFSNSKTDTINELTAGAGVTVDGCLIKDGVAAEATIANQVTDQGGGTDLKVKVLEIGDWNMDTTPTAGVAHGLTITNIRAVTVVIRNDADDTYYTMPVNPTQDLYSPSISATNVALTRVTSGIFDNVGFDSTSYNRGWVTILHI